MKLKEKDLKEIVKMIKNKENYNNIGNLLDDVLKESYYCEDLFYTIEYADIIINDNKTDNSYKEDLECDIQKMLLYILKNTNIIYDKNYFNIILEFIKLDQGLYYDGELFVLDSEYNNKIEAREYNELLFFLSVDYSNKFIRESEDYLFNTAINQNFQECFTNLIDTYSYYNKSEELFKELEKYSPIICKIILKNSEYIKDLGNKKLYQTNEILIESYLFNILVSIFISNIKEFNYDYQIISESMLELMNNYKKEIYSLFNQSYQISIEQIEALKQVIYDILSGFSMRKCKKLN